MTRPIELEFDQLIDDSRYVCVCVMENSALRLHLSDMRVTGLVALQYWRDQTPVHDIGVESFEFWTPPRRPGWPEYNDEFLAAAKRLRPAECLQRSGAPGRRSERMGGLIPADDKPTLDIKWIAPQSMSRVTLMFDTDFDHAMETVTRGHPEDVMPFAVKHFRLRNGDGAVLAEVTDNHQTVNRIEFDEPIEIDHLQVEVVASHGDAPAAVFAVHCYE